MKVLDPQSPKEGKRRWLRRSTGGIHSDRPKEVSLVSFMSLDVAPRPSNMAGFQWPSVVYKMEDCLNPVFLMSILVRIKHHHILLFSGGFCLFYVS